MKKLDMRHTRRALAEYDRTGPERDARWANAMTNEDVFAAERADLVAINAVREAFYLDTTDRNNFDTCMCIAVSHARQTVEAHASPSS